MPFSLEECSNILKQLLNHKNDKTQGDMKGLDNWIKKVHGYTNHYNSLDVIHFQLSEICHYVTVNDIAEGKIPLQRDKSYVKQMYVQKRLNDEEDKLYQKPYETFGEKVHGMKCINKHCNQSDVVICPIQTRSSDEPTSYFYECRNCNRKWKDK